MKKAPDKFLEQFSETNYSSQFKRNEIIFKQGTPIAYVPYLISGLVKIVDDHLPDRPAIIKLSTERQVLELSSLFTGRIYRHTAYAVDTCEVCFIEKQEFLDKVRCDSDFVDMINGMTSQSEIDAYDRLLTLSKKQLPGRLAHLLLHFSSDLYKHKSFVLPLSRNEMADYLGVTTKSFNRVLKIFCNDNVIKIEGKRVTILNNELLRKLSAVG